MGWRWDAPEVWPASRRGALLLIIAGVVVFLSIRYALNPSYVNDPQPAFPARARDLADRVDPNRADWPTLAAIPMIGEKRAKDIVAHRENFLARNGDAVAFAQLEDLLKIKGIGPALMLSLEPYLIFPAAARPSANR